MMDSALTVDFSPLLGAGVLYLIIALTLVLLGFSAFFYRRGLVIRILCAITFILLLLNPSMVEEKRDPVPDVAVLAVDRSPSQHSGERMDRTDEALTQLKTQLDQIPELEVRIIESARGEEGPSRETHIFSKVDEALADVPAARRAGLIVLTDGQIHDVPGQSRFGDYGPVHGLLSGERDERDRQLVIKEASSYGIVGQDVTIRYRIEDSNTDNEHATLLIRQDSKAPRVELVPVNTDQTLTVNIGHAGQNIVDLEVSPLKDELTTANNRVPLIINGVRDRLRVLLVSGQPHAGGRTWRNLLTSDPGVDLVHFTILREPDKLDATPPGELSLIAFPFQELFEIKLYDFDLVIFDRYRLNRILPNYYFSNIARYVKEGGALLEASGPSFAREDSIFSTALRDILPAYPTGEVYEESYTPSITETGSRHPVTQDLEWPGGSEEAPGWGPWLRHVAVAPTAGDILMSGVNDLPLLILNRVGEGRVAQMASDQIWLWSRGFKGGGPQAELLRRLAHWLMKEPELEESSLTVRELGGQLIIKRRSLKEEKMEAEVTLPDGTKQTVNLLLNKDSGMLEARIPAEQLGVYTVSDGIQQRFALVGDINPPELMAVKTTEDKLKPLTEASRGGIHWLADRGTPAIRLLPPERDYDGRNWIGLRRNDAYDVAGVTDRPFLPPWIYAALLLGLVITAWWYEGKAGNRKDQ